MEQQKKIQHLQDKGLFAPTKQIQRFPNSLSPHFIFLIITKNRKKKKKKDNALYIHIYVHLIKKGYVIIGNAAVASGARRGCIH